MQHIMKKTRVDRKFAELQDIVLTSEFDKFRLVGVHGVFPGPYEAFVFREFRYRIRGSGIGRLLPRAFPGRGIPRAIP